MPEMYDGAPLLHNSLARLTLSDVHDRISLWFIKTCPAVSVRLSDCLNPSHPDYPSLGRLLARNSSLSCLVLRHDDLPLGEVCLLENICRIASLQYLCLLSAAPLMDNDAAFSVLAFAASLSPQSVYTFTTAAVPAAPRSGSRGCSGGAFQAVATWFETVPASSIVRRLRS
ncbi:uncharacterized protein LOC142590983 [Dermacentor variabilis]|uniref:uncharacterized protein LOC142590983 n=1 Tax=Dermacentor variabilis TaxID=34621 RepID=UPI003F5B8AF8